MSYKFSKDDLDTQFDAFLRDSVSSDESLNKYLKKPLTKERKPKWFEDDNENSNTIGTGLSPSGKSFLKAQTSETVDDSFNIDNKTTDTKQKQRTKKDVPTGRGLRMKSELSLSRDSLEDISEKSEIENSDEKKKISITKSNFDSAQDHSGIGTNDLGIDTLDELVDKAKFFQGLEENGDQSVDYNRLIGEISGTTYNPCDTVNKLLDDSTEPDNRRHEIYHNEKQDDSHIHSFEKDSSQQKPSMLSKVSLLDSMDSTLNTTASPKVGRSRDPDVSGENVGLTVPGLSKLNTGTEFMGTNTSKEIEDLHQAMREVGMSTATTGPPDHHLTASQDQLVNHMFDVNKNGKERPVSEIFRDIDNIESNRVIQTDSTPEVNLSDYKAQHNKKGSQSSISEEMRVDPAGGFDHSHTEDTEVYQPIISVGGYYHQVIKDSVKDKNKSSGAVNKKLGKSRSRYSTIQSSGYGKRSPSASPIRSPTRPISDKTKNLSKSSPNISKENSSNHKVQSKLKYEQKLSDKKMQDQQQLLASVDSFTRYIKGQINGRPLPGAKWSNDEPSQSGTIKLDTSIGGLDREQVLLQELKELQQQWQEVQNENITVNADMLSQKKVHAQEIEHLQLAHEKQLFKIKQENFVLAAKSQAEDEHKIIFNKEGLDNVAKEKINQLEKEIKEQETLIVGYQQENQRLYNDSKHRVQNQKETEGSMFKENQKLSREVAQLRDDLSQKEYQLKNKGVITSATAQQQIAAGNTNTAVLGASKISELASELKDITKQYGISQRELKVLQKTKVELEQHIDTLIREREDLAKQLEFAKTLRPEEARIIEDQYQQEINKLNRKLKWYAENQELLDKSALTIRTKDGLIEKLKKQVEDLQTETGQRLEENKMRLKEKAVESKKIQDLERQVKEMDQIIRRRHPNSLPAMILAAGAVPDNNSDKKTPSNQVLENRIKKLEGELASKDSENDQLLRALEQKYNTVKLQFEGRINDLEFQLSRFQRPGDPLFKDYDHPHTHVVALQKELNSTRDKYKKQTVEFQAEIVLLQTELQKFTKNNDHNTSKINISSDSELRQQILQLQQTVENKSHDNQVLQKSLEKLRKEKHLYFKNTTDGSKKSKSKKNGRRSEENGLDEDHKSVNVTDNNTQDILRENDHLKKKVERLQLSLDQQRVDLRKSLAETEAIVRKSREEYEDRIDTMRSCHQKEFQRMLIEQAVHNSTSKVAELHSKCDAQEVLIRHLKEQVSRNEVEAEQISVLKIREVSLISQVDKLKDDLVEAKRNYTPGMKHFVSIQEKIDQMGRRHEKREEELQDVIKNTQNLASTELNREAEKWRQIVEVKNNEIEKFRIELDSILNVIRILQQQGVVLPLKS